MIDNSYKFPADIRHVIDDGPDVYYQKLMFLLNVGITNVYYPIQYNLQ